MKGEVTLTRDRKRNLGHQVFRTVDSYIAWHHCTPVGIPNSLCAISTCTTCSSIAQCVCHCIGIPCLPVHGVVQMNAFRFLLVVGQHAHLTAEKISADFLTDVLLILK